MKTGDECFNKFRYLPISVRIYLFLATIICFSIFFSIDISKLDKILDYWSLLILFVLAIILGTRPLIVVRSGEYHLLSLIWFTTILLFPPIVVFIFVFLTSLISDLATNARKTAIIINIVEEALGHYFAAVVFQQLKSSASIQQDLISNIIAMVASVFVIQAFYLISHAIVFSSVFKNTFRASFMEVLSTMPIIEIGQYSVAILLAIILNVQKVAVFLFVLPIILLYVTSNYQIRLAKKEREAIIDQLSGLFNRRHFDSILESFTSGKNYRRFIMLMIDADNFKVTNDVLGHVEGDRTIKKISTIIKSTLRDEDIAFRYGGEEFAVILPSITKSEAKIVAERIRVKAANSFKSSQIKTTLSIGLSQFPNDASDAEGLIVRADEALYRAKSKGKNCVISA